MIVIGPKTLNNKSLGYSQIEDRQRRKGAVIRPEEKQHFPTVLVVEADDELRSTLVDRIRQEGYLVLEAPDRGTALHIARIHSRHIHLLVIGESTYERNWTANLERYRPKMRVIIFAAHPKETHSDALAPESVLPKIREFFGAFIRPPKR